MNRGHLWKRLTCDGRQQPSPKAPQPLSVLQKSAEGGEGQSGFVFWPILTIKIIIGHYWSGCFQIGIRILIIHSSQVQTGQFNASLADTAV